MEDLEGRIAIVRKNHHPYDANRTKPPPRTVVFGPKQWFLAQLAVYPFPHHTSRQVLGITRSQYHEPHPFRAFTAPTVTACQSTDGRISIPPPKTGLKSSLSTGKLPSPGDRPEIQSSTENYPSRGRSIRLRLGSAFASGGDNSTPWVA